MYRNIPIEALVIFICGILGVKILSYLVNTKLSVWAQKTTSKWDDIFILLLQKRIIPFLYLFFALSAINTLPIPTTIPPRIEKFLVALGAILAALIILDFVKAALELKISRLTEQGHKGIVSLIKIIIWMITALFILDNFGFKVTSIIAGLGIGGVAVALAAQTLLSDFFNYFAIMLDQPFEIGDFVVIGETSGTIESIGLKSTKIRSLVGEQIILSNTQLMNSRLQNYKRMDNRRIVFNLGVEYSTPYEKLQSIPEIIKKIISEIQDVRLDRCHFSKFADSSLNFEIVYYVDSRDYNIFMDKQQKMLLEIYKEFEAAKIAFAFPTSTVHIAKD